MRTNQEIAFVFKRTDELNDAEKNQLIGLFSNVFGKTISVDNFNRKFLHTVKSYSYHGLMVSEGVIVGSYSAIPYEYLFFGKKYIFALAVDTMVKKEFRKELFNVKKMANLVYSALKKDQIPFIFGFPNKNIYEYRKKVLEWKDVGVLDYYILPRKIGALHKSLSFLNPFSKTISLILSSLGACTTKAEAGEYNIEKINNECFMKSRYDKSYNSIHYSDNGICVYKSYIEDRAIDSLYVIDVKPLSSKNMCRSIRDIYRREAKTFDLLLYIGKLPFTPQCLIKVPDSLKPKEIKMSGKILDPDTIDERVYSINNWNINLSNFDVR